jgi:hypothetical protein
MEFIAEENEAQAHDSTDDRAVSDGSKAAFVSQEGCVGDSLAAAKRHISYSTTPQSPYTTAATGDIRQRRLLPWRDDGVMNRVGQTDRQTDREG